MIVNFGIADIKQKAMGEPIVVIWWWDQPYVNGYTLEAVPFPYWNAES